MDSSDSVHDSSLPDETPPADAPRSSRAADSALAGCLLIVGTFAILAFLYLGFFALAICDGWYGWGLLDPYIDERTGAFLEIIYWPLIVLFAYFELL